MKVPEHIYIADGPKQTKTGETRLKMVVPSRITVGGEEKAQPIGVLDNKMINSAANIDVS